VEVGVDEAGDQMGAAGVDRLRLGAAGVRGVPEDRHPRPPGEMRRRPRRPPSSPATRSVSGAPLDVVCDLHADISASPSLKPDGSESRLEQPSARAPPSPETYDLDIESSVDAIAEHTRILRGRTVAGITGPHQWTFTGISDRVQVSTEDSSSGQPVAADPARSTRFSSTCRIANVRQVRSRL
jgi:hypothetical protein